MNQIHLVFFSEAWKVIFYPQCPCATMLHPPYMVSLYAPITITMAIPDSLNDDETDNNVKKLTRITSNHHDDADHDDDADITMTMPMITMTILIRTPMRTTMPLLITVMMLIATTMLITMTMLITKTMLINAMQITVLIITSMSINASIQYARSLNSTVGQNNQKY